MTYEERTKIVDLLSASITALELAQEDGKKDYEKKYLLWLAKRSVVSTIDHVESHHDKPGKLNSDLPTM